MIENYRSELLWKLFMSSPEIAPALQRLGFVPDTDPAPAPTTPTVLEDFEGGTADLAWQALDGSYAGPVANPAPDAINGSARVGSYEKADGAAYSLLLANVPGGLDLSTNNQFSIQVNAGAPTQLLLKLEGGGQSIERTVNIATAGVWRTYTFDFLDAACYTGLTSVVLFFDPGVAASSDTYYFDNLVAGPAGACAGTAVDPTVIDDFECQRNATYGVPGFDDLTVVDNPDQGAANPSDKVGRYTDQAGPYHALVIDYAAPLDLAARGQVCLKVWAPKTGQLLFKLQGDGVGIERGLQITETGTWVDACVDFSDQAGTDYTQIVLFFNAGEDGSGDVYYVDDLTRDRAPATAVLEDFEGGTSLYWSAIGESTYRGAVANPITEGNGSATVGSYTRTAAAATGVFAKLATRPDLSYVPRLNLDVVAPAAGTEVLVALESPTRGRVTASAVTTTGGAWETLTFDFSTYASVRDFASVTLEFGTAGQYYFDNLTVGDGTPNPCADVVNDPTILDDFNCQRNVTYTIGSEFLSVVEDPAAAGTGNRVGAFDDPPGAYNALVADNGAAFDLSAYNQLSLDVLAPVAGTVLFKLEGETADGPLAPVEFSRTISSPGTWETFTVDLRSVAGVGYSRLVLFFGAGADNASVNTYYIDNLRLKRPVFLDDCVFNMETTAQTPVSGGYFANGSFDGTGLTVIDNPVKDALNGSDRVAVFREAADGTQPFAGLGLTLSYPVTLTADNKTATLDVWMPNTATVVLKLEQGNRIPAATGDAAASYTTPGAWQKLTFDLGAAVTGAEYERVTLIMNSTEIPATDQTYYFDNLAVGNGSCGATAARAAAPTAGLRPEISTPADLRAYPNPVGTELTIAAPAGAVRLTLVNPLGQPVRERTVAQGGGLLRWELNGLRGGAYLLLARDAAGEVIGRTTVIKR